MGDSCNQQSICSGQIEPHPSNFVDTLASPSNCLPILSFGLSLVLSASTAPQLRKVKILVNLQRIKVDSGLFNLPNRLLLQTFTHRDDLTVEELVARLPDPHVRHPAAPLSVLLAAGEGTRHLVLGKAGDLWRATGPVHGLGADCLSCRQFNRATSISGIDDLCAGWYHTGRTLARARYNIMSRFKTEVSLEKGACLAKKTVETQTE